MMLLFPPSRATCLALGGDFRLLERGCTALIMAKRICRLSVLIVATALLPAGVAAAQIHSADPDEGKDRWKIPQEYQPGLAGPGIEIPVLTYTAPDGSLKLKRGVMAGVEVAPGASLGLGLFETLPKKKKSLDPDDDPMDRKQRRSRKAAIGFSMKF